MQDVSTVLIRILKEQGHVCDVCGDSDIGVASVPWQFDDDDQPPGEYVQKCYCGPCFLRKLQQKRH